MISLNQSLWLDEAIGAIAVHDYSYLGILHDYIRGDTHPPLYYLTLKLWTDIFGYREVAMRMLSVIFGVLTVYVLYVIAKLKSIEWGGKNINTFPLIAAALLATAPLHIYYSQEVRMYAMNTLLVSLIVLFYIQKDWWKYAISVLLLGMTDYLPLLVLPALFIHALSEKHDLSWWKQFVGSHFPLGVFLLIWFPTFQIQSAGSREALQLFSGWGDLIGRAGVKELSLVWVKFLIGRISFDNKILYGGIVLLMTFCISYPFIKSIRDVLKTKIWWLWVVVPVMLTFLGAVFIPGFSYFRMIIVLPAFYVLIAYGLSRMGSRALVVIILVANCVFSLEYLINTKHHREDWKGAVSYVESTYKDGDIVLQAFPEPFAGYRWYSNTIHAYGGTWKLGAVNSEIESYTKDNIEKANGVFYFEYLADQTDPNSIIKKTLLENGFSQVEVKDIRGVGFIEYYQRE
jgi:uncharacterized membrane protein